MSEGKILNNSRIYLYGLDEVGNNNLFVLQVEEQNKFSICIYIYICLALINNNILYVFSNIICTL